MTLIAKAKHVTISVGSKTGNKPVVTGNPDVCVCVFVCVLANTHAHTYAPVSGSDAAFVVVIVVLKRLEKGCFPS